MGMIQAEHSDGEKARETIHHWMVECPENLALAKADISARGVPFATSYILRFTVKNCSFWPGRTECGQECIRSLAQEGETNFSSKQADEKS
jgi:hypothetical protein